jgi:hypothetical protein
MTQKLEAGITEHLDNGNIGTSGKVIVVTKQGQDGGIQIDAFTGVVLNANDNPEWAEGLTNALLAERHIFYTGRLGALYTADMKSPETLAYEDLAWVHAQPYEEPLLAQEEVRNEEGQIVQHAIWEHVELQQLDANEEFRMGRIAEITGIEFVTDEDGAVVDVVGDISHEMQIDNERSEEELAAMEQAKNTGFSKVAGE